MKPLHFGLAAITLALSVLGQDPIQDPEAALATAQTRLQGLADPQTDADKAQQKAVSARVSLLRELIATRQAAGALTAGDDIGQRRATAESGLQVVKALPALTAVALSDPSEVTGHEDAQREATRDRDAKQDALAALEARRSTLGDERRNLPDRRADLAPRLNAKPADDDLSGQYALENAKLEAEVIKEREKYIDDVGPVDAALKPVLQLELDLAEAHLARAKKSLELARGDATRLRDAEAATARAQAEEAERAAAAETDPIEIFHQRISAEIQRSTAQRAAIETRTEGLNTLQEEEAEALRWVENETKRVRKRMDLRGERDIEVARRTLTSVERSQDRLERLIAPRVEKDGDDFRGSLANLLDRLFDLQLPEEENPELEKLLEKVRTDNPDRIEAAKTAFDTEVNGEAGLEAVLRAERLSIEAAQDVLEAIDSKITERRTGLASLSHEINTQLIWRRDEPLLGLDLSSKLSRDLDDLATGATSDAAGEAFRSTREGNLKLSLLALGLLLIGTWSFFRNAKQKTRARVGLAWVAMASLRLFPVPAGLMLLAFVLRAAPGDSVARNVAILFELLAWLSFARRIGWELLRPPSGLAVRFQVMLSGVASHLLHCARVALFGAQLTWAPAVALESQPMGLHGLPQLLFFAWYVVFACVLMTLFSKRKKLMGEWASTEPGLGVFLGIFRFLVIPYQIGIIVAASIGYQAFARYTSHRVIWVTGVVIALAWLYAFSVRSLQAMLERVAKSAIAKTDGEDQEPVLPALSSGLARPLSLMLILAIAIPLGYFAGFGSPLRELFSGISLGVEIAPGELLTMWDVVIAISVIVAGQLVGSNIGKLYENLIAPLVGEQERGARYALITLTRYAIIFIAWSAALLIVGVSLGSIGWLLTAVSVGLGFGLQEIVANFISGLILLFERPIRVGDTITVGQTGGIVDSISIRSTVVTNWERQTIIIPNKNFVTQNLTNWTRNDEIMRRSLCLRVKYGADIEKVLRILDEVVAAHPKVEKEPPHRIWFEEFGEFGLELKIWFFTYIDDGLRTKTELHAAIYESFRREGIEFPVITRDLRVEDSEGNYPMLPSGES